MQVAESREVSIWDCRTSGLGDLRFEEESGIFPSR